MTDQILDARQQTHGAFADVARVAQHLKGVLYAEDKFWKLPVTMRESLEMQASKIARILAGNPEHADHWEDVAGYARLVLREVVARNALAEALGRDVGAAAVSSLAEAGEDADKGAADA